MTSVKSLVSVFPDGFYASIYIGIQVKNSHFLFCGLGILFLKHICTFAVVTVYLGTLRGGGCRFSFFSFDA